VLTFFIQAYFRLMYRHYKVTHVPCFVSSAIHFVRTIGPYCKLRHVWQRKSVQFLAFSYEAPHRPLQEMVGGCKYFTAVADSAQQ